MRTPALARARAARLAIFLDFDGCLVDIAARPQDVVVPRRLPSLLSRLARRSGGALALVSGRPAADLMRFLPGLDAQFVGSHGAERAVSRGPIARIPIDGAALARAAQAADASGIPGLLVERKPVGLGLHYRAAPARRAEVADLAERLLADLPGFHGHHGKMVVELRPDGIGKGAALARAMRMAPFAGRVPVMFGDDATDEPAFGTAARFGGFSVKVGQGPTTARARLGSPAEVRRLLAIWARGGDLP